jgi:hypothetical protein
MSREDLLSLREQFKSADVDLLAALQQKTLGDAGLLDPQSATVESAENAVTRAIQTWDELTKRAANVQQAASTRFSTALTLLRSPTVGSGIPDIQQMQDEAAELTVVLRELSGVFPGLLELRKQFTKLHALIPYAGSSNTEYIETALKNEAEESNRLVQEIQNLLGATVYPFRQPNTNTSLAEFARAKSYEPDAVKMAFSEAQSHLQMLFAAYFQVLGRLVVIAGLVEQKLEKTPANQPQVRIVPKS